MRVPEGRKKSKIRPRQLNKYPMRIREREFEGEISSSRETRCRFVSYRGPERESNFIGYIVCGKRAVQWTKGGLFYMVKTRAKDKPQHPMRASHTQQILKEDSRPLSIVNHT